ncbi:membrane protein insertase YidC [Candidatus Aerophobetes bacterium]|uniref:Membrane protein insertase YidC n=1 Tax=Aerophobetes bacterium TaxID=2030807 RepID=A0A523RNK7_UNCAE|nr:MAG: membrane protein insertase YidC [Candidatus Aerophobetes bacterium]
MEKNVILAIVLSVIVLLFYNFFILQRQTSPPQEEERPSFVQEETPPLPEEVFPTEEEELTLENDYAKLAFTSRGGRIKSWYLKKDKKEMVGKGAYALGLNLFLPQGEVINLNGEVFQVKREGEKKVIFTWEDEERGFKISKSFELKEGYDGRIGIETRNLPWGSEYELIWEGGIGEEYKGEEGLAFFGVEVQEQFKQGIREDYRQGIKWMGLRQKRKLLVILASLGQPIGGTFRLDFWGLKDNKIHSEWIIYAGPQNYAELRLLNSQIKNGYGEDYHLAKALDLSIWGQLSKMLMDILFFFYSFTHNYGIAIILLTLLIYGILSPLTFKQFSSMQKMQVIQPEIQAIQKKFKGEPKQLQIEMMKIYRKHKVNPMSGCFPLLIQMPIIFVLYRALIDFPFSENPSFLWIKDLGKPNIPLLLLLGGMMFLQQRITQKTQVQAGGQQQGMAKMMQFFPIFIIVMLWSLPSGVMLYWFTSTLISVLQQFLIRKKTLLASPAKV